MNGQRIPGTPLVVDYWKIRKLPPRLLFFLTHMHADHTSGLSATWPYPIHCTPVTAKLLKHKFNVNPKLVVELELDTPYLLHYTPPHSTDRMGITVTAIDANHCPGSAMFLFQGFFGRILYTGDFRYSPSMTDHPLLRPSCTLDALYLDNTYCDTSCVFPTREESTATIISLIKQHPQRTIYLGMHTLGKEDLLVTLAMTLGCRVGVDEERMQRLKLLEMPDVFDTDMDACWVRVYPFHALAKNYIKDVQSEEAIGILPTALYVGHGAMSQPSHVKVVPYSDHSSFTELRMFVRHLRPRCVNPVVRDFTGDRAVIHTKRTDMSIFNDLLDLSVPSPGSTNDFKLPSGKTLTPTQKPRYTRKKQARAIKPSPTSMKVKRTHIKKKGVCFISPVKSNEQTSESKEEQDKSGEKPDEREEQTKHGRLSKNERKEELKGNEVKKDQLLSTGIVEEVEEEEPLKGKETGRKSDLPEHRNEVREQRKPEDREKERCSIDGVYLETGSPPPMVLAESRSKSSLNTDSSSTSSTALTQPATFPAPLDVISGSHPTTPDIAATFKPISQSPLGSSRNLLAFLRKAQPNSAPCTDISTGWKMPDPSGCSRIVPVDKLRLKNPRWGQSAEKEGVASAGGDVASNSVDAQRVCDSNNCCGATDTKGKVSATDVGMDIDVSETTDHNDCIAGTDGDKKNNASVVDNVGVTSSNTPDAADTENTGSDATETKVVSVACNLSTDVSAGIETDDACEANTNKSDAIDASGANIVAKDTNTADTIDASVVNAVTENTNTAEMASDANAASECTITAEAMDASDTNVVAEDTCIAGTIDASSVSAGTEDTNTTNTIDASAVIEATNSTEKIDAIAEVTEDTNTAEAIDAPDANAITEDANTTETTDASDANAVKEDANTTETIDASDANAVTEDTKTTETIDASDADAIIEVTEDTNAAEAIDASNSISGTVDDHNNIDFDCNAKSSVSASAGDTIGGTTSTVVSSIIDKYDTADSTIDAADTTDADSTSDFGDPIDTQAMIREMQQQLLNFKGPSTALLHHMKLACNLGQQASDCTGSSSTFDWLKYCDKKAASLSTAAVCNPNDDYLPLANKKSSSKRKPSERLNRKRRFTEDFIILSPKRSRKEWLSPFKEREGERSQISETRRHAILRLIHSARRSVSTESETRSSEGKGDTPEATEPSNFSSSKVVSSSKVAATAAYASIAMETSSADVSNFTTPVAIETSSISNLSPKEEIMPSTSDTRNFFSTQEYYVAATSDVMETSNADISMVMSNDSISNLNPEVGEVKIYPKFDEVITAFGITSSKDDSFVEHAQQCACPLCRVGLAAICTRSHDIAGCQCETCRWGLENYFTSWQ